MILTNGTIYSLDGKNYEAAAVVGNRIAKLGTTKEIEAAASDSAKKIDLRGKCVFPGFIDSHMHLVEYGLCARMINLEEASSVEDVIARSKTYLEKDKSGLTWILGYGWNESRFKTPAMPTRRDLDLISRDLPIMITRVCEHIAVVNSKALEITGADEKTAVKGGSFDKNADGELTGVIRENALDWFTAHLPGRNVDEIKEAIITASDELVRMGITSVHTSDLHSCSFDVMYDSYLQLQKEGRLPIRIYEQLFLPDLNQLEQFLSRDCPPEPDDAMFRLGPVKLLTDGCLGARTAALRDDYSDDTGNRGAYIYEQAELDALVLKAHTSGRQMFIHAIGDGAIDSSLKALERAMMKDSHPHRHTINHFQIGSPDLFQRASELGVLAAIQPSFVSSDWNMAGSKVGPDRIKSSYAWKTMWDLGIPVMGSSDCPVESCNPLHGIYASVTRKDLNGHPAEGFLPTERLTVEQAIRLYTTNGAYGSFDENRKGMLTAGYLADMVVLSEDPFEVNPEKLKDISVLMTIVDGKIKYLSKDFADVK